MSKTLDDIFDRVVDDIYKGKIRSGDVDPEFIQELAQEVWKAVKKGYNLDFDSPGLQTHDFEMLQHLERNVYVFYGFQNYHQLRDITSLLYDEQGNVRPFADFKKDVKDIDENYNVNYLAAEYDFAVNSSAMASRWVQFQVEKGALPFLQYQTVGDSRVRASHAALDKIIKKVDDPFWNNYYPPNGWGCRCSVRQLTEGEETKIDKSLLPELPPMFRNNTAKQGVVFPESHPYYNVNKQTRQSILKAVEKIIPNRQEFQRVHEGKKGGYVDVHPAHSKQERVENIETGIILANQGYKVKLLAVSSKPGAKNPDAMIGIKQFEIKHNHKASKGAIDSELRKAKSQANNILLHVKSSIKPGALASAIQNRVARSENVQSLMLYYQGKLLVFTRKQILNKGFKIE
jgi:SPP1 gp7 family putative phage head morphogenesis protein